MLGETGDKWLNRLHMQLSRELRSQGWSQMEIAAFARGDIGQAASSAMVMMMVVFAIVVPYLYSELRARND